MLEPQDHPNDFAYPGAPPTRPYDTTGWTLAYQMGVNFDRLYGPVPDPSRRSRPTSPPRLRESSRASAAPPATSSRTSTTTPTPSPTAC